MIEWVFVTFVLSLTLFYLWFYNQVNYWKKRDVPFYDDPSLPFGNLVPVWSAKKPFVLDVADGYHRIKKAGYKYFIYFTSIKPNFVVVDIGLVKHILSIDFGNFVNHGVFFNEKDDPLSAHLFAIEDDKWKSLRQRLTPTFTSGKLKMMFQTMLDCGTPLRNELERVYKAGEVLDARETMAKFTTDIIGSCAFGVNCNSFENEDAEFRKHGRLAFEASSKLKAAKRLFLNVFAETARRFRMVGVEKEVTEFFMNMLHDTVGHRTKNSVRRNDFLQLLIDLKESKSLTFNELAAQAYVFFLAGFETSSTTLSFAFYEISKNVRVQEKLRNEINEVLKQHNGEITYESVKEMKYMDQVIEETLRKYPPVPMLQRKCTKDYTIPDTKLTLKKGTNVFIPAYGIHYDPEFYPEPEEFKPERFAPENKSKLTPFSWLPFGEGPRICIGLRFGMLQTKIGMISVLRDYRISSVNEKLEYNPRGIVLTTIDPVCLRLEKV